MQIALSQGDQVMLDGHTRGRIRELLPKQAEKPQTYLVELSSGGYIVTAADRLTMIEFWRRTCECGTQKVPGQANVHSHWCPASQDQAELDAKFEMDYWLNYKP